MSPLGMFKEQKGDQCGWSSGQNGYVEGDKGVRGGAGQVGLGDFPGTLRATGVF